MAFEHLVAKVPGDSQTLHVVLPAREYEAHGEAFGVGGDADEHGHPDEPARTAEAQDADDCDSHDEAPGFGEVGVVAGGATEFCPVEEVTGEFQREERGEQLPVASEELLLTEPEGGSDSEVEDGIGPRIGTAQGWGVAVPEAGEDAVGDIVHQRDEDDEA